LIAALGGVYHHDTPRGAFTQGELLRALIRHGRAVPHDMEREQQPVLIIGECRIDLLPYRIALARELRALIADLLQAQFYRIKVRRGPKKAIMAVAASILTAIYHMLKDGTMYKDLGRDHFDRRSTDRQKSA
jgi:hypothetical protein